MTDDNINRFDLISVCIGAGMSFIISLLALAVIALILQFTEFPAKLIEPSVRAVSLLGPFFGGFVAVRRIGSFGWLNGGAVGAACMIFLYIIGGIAGHDFSISISTFLMFLISTCAGAIGGILGINLRYR